MRHVLTIHLVIDIPDADEDQHDTTRDAFEAAVDNALDAGEIQKLVMSAAGDFDGFDPEAEITAASCVMDEFEPSDEDDDEDVE